MNRGCGILLPVFSLPSNQGIGDFGPEGYRFADLLAVHGVEYWQILPLNPGNPPNAESPYFSISAFAINPLLISLEFLKRDGLITASELETFPVLPAHTIAYDELRAAKMPLLEKASERFLPTEAFDVFCRTQQHWLEDFALFDVLRDEHPGLWSDWPLALREREPWALAAFAQSQAKAILMRKIIQYLAWSQWQELRRYCKNKNIIILGDMPIYVALDSADTWANPGLFKLDAQRRPVAVSGVPPDYFSATGQLWNNPVYRWDAHEAENFAWWIGRLGHMFSLYDMVRIDHFRGLVQYWEIPAGEPTAMNGAWKDVPTRALFDAFLRRFNPFPVVCEDLGIITEDVREAMAHYNLPGMKILQFAFGDDDPKNPYLPQNYPESCLVYTGTHDNQPTLGWLSREADPKTLARLAKAIGRVASNEEKVWALIELAVKSIAQVAVFPLQDILTLDETSRINNPAKLDGNWRWRWDAKSNPALLAMERLEKLLQKHERKSTQA